MEQLEARVVAVERDSEHGATFLTESAIELLGDAATTFAPTEAWASDVRRLAGRLTLAKPSMAGLSNATGLLLARLLDLGPAEGRRQAPRLARELSAELRVAGRSASENAVPLLGPGSTVATCSYSSAVMRTCRAARDRGRLEAVLVFEPQAGPRAAGHRLAGHLKDAGCRASTVGGPAEEVVRRADLVLIGADAITAEAVVNGTPTAELAAAASPRIPLYVVCETIKFTADVEIAPGYDSVLLELVTDVVTEEGRLGRSAVAAYVERQGRAAPRW